MFQKPDTKPVSETKKDSQSAHDDVETVVGPSVRVEGDFSSEGNIIVKGVVCGNVKTSKLLTVENGAKIFANVKSGTAVISGGIKGNVKVVDKLELTETAQIQGDVSCKVLDVAAGALIQGKVSMQGIHLKDDDENADKKHSLSRMKLGGDKEKK